MNQPKKLPFFWFSVVCNGVSSARVGQVLKWAYKIPNEMTFQLPTIDREYWRNTASDNRVIFQNIHPVKNELFMGMVSLMINGQIVGKPTHWQGYLGQWPWAMCGIVHWRDVDRHGRDFALVTEKLP